MWIQKLLVLHAMVHPKAPDDNDTSLPSLGTHRVSVKVGGDEVGALVGYLSLTQILTHVLGAFAF